MDPVALSILQRSRSPLFLSSLSLCYRRVSVVFMYVHCCTRPPPTHPPSRDWIQGPRKLESWSLSRTQDRRVSSSSSTLATSLSSYHHVRPLCSSRAPPVSWSSHTARSREPLIIAKAGPGRAMSLAAVCPLPVGNLWSWSTSYDCFQGHQHAPADSNPTLFSVSTGALSLYLLPPPTTTR
jgi:hypothetical protein